MGVGRVREDLVNGVFSARGVAPGYIIKPFQGYNASSGGLGTLGDGAWGRCQNINL
jgi:hypothetical protein